MHIDRQFIILFILAALVFTANIGGFSIYILDEAKNTECAREMFVTENLVVPNFNYELRTDKPALHYYYMIAGFKLFGVNAFGARFFSAICGILTTLLTYLFVRDALGKKVGFYSGLSLVASLQVAIQFHLAVPDPYLICLVSFALFAFHRGLMEGKPFFFYLTYAALGLATLAKGPVAIALPGLIALIFMIWNGRLTWKGLLSIRPFTGLLLYLAVVLPWYFAVHFQTDGEWTYGFFVRHNFERYTDTMEGHGGPFFLPLVFIITGLLPFSLFIFQAGAQAWKNRKESLLLFSLLTVVVFVIFFGFSSTKLPSYPAPCFPFAAVLLGYFLNQLENGGSWKRYGARFSYFFYALIAFALPIGIYIALSFEQELSHLQYLAWYFAALPVGAALAIYFGMRGNLQKSFYSMAASFFITSLLFFYVVFPKVDKENPVESAHGKIPPDAPVVYYHRMNSAFVFDLQKRVVKFTDVQQLQNFIGNREVYVITAKRHLEDLIGTGTFEVVHQKRDLFEIPTTVVVKSVGK